MKFQLTILLVCLSVVLADRYSSRFASFKAKHGKKYGKDEEKVRFAKFNRNVDDIDTHNERFLNGETLYVRDINQFSDMLEHEKFNFTGLLSEKHVRPVRSLAGPYQFGAGRPTFNVYSADAADLAAAPKSLDWTQKGFTKAVQNQGQCGSCYAFAGAAVVDAGLKVQKGIDYATSQQEFVDCTKSLGNYGCDGGLIQTPLEYSIMKGAVKEGDYPYTMKAGTCNSAKLSGSVQKLVSFVKVKDHDEKSVMAAISKYGPCVTSLDVEDGLMQYTKGIYDGKNNGVSECTSQVNHAVVIVGYGTENGVDYWKIRNSWGAKWGEAGHFRIARNRANLCGVANDVYCPVAK